jgi:hypothetical protein
MPGVDLQGAGRCTQRVKVMVARLLFGRAGGIGYIFLPSRDIVSDIGASVVFDTYVDFSNGTC